MEAAGWVAGFDAGWVSAAGRIEAIPRIVNTERIARVFITLSSKKQGHRRWLD